MAKGLIAALAAGVLVAGCGGGGGGSAAQPPPANLSSAPGNPAIATFYQTAVSRSLSGSDSAGNAWTAQFVLTPNSGTTTFNNSTVESATITTTVTLGGQSNIATQTSYFTLNPFTPVGSVLSNQTQYEVIQTWTPLPATVTVGQTGNLGTSTTYSTPSQGSVDGVNVYTYSVTALSPTALQLCLADVFTANTPNPDGLTSNSSTTCFAVTAAGVASISEIVTTIGGITITLK